MSGSFDETEAFTGIIDEFRMWRFAKSQVHDTLNPEFEAFNSRPQSLAVSPVEFGLNHKF
jgi:hypothetical protein